MRRSLHKRGFTIVELLIVIVVVGILSTISVAAFSGVQNRAYDAIYQNDTSVIYKAVLSARQATGQTLGQLTGSYWSLGSCLSSGNNPGNIEPRSLPYDHPCWQRYYAILEALGTASGTNLSQLRKGDPNNNPYMFDENDGETCSPDNLYVFRNNGTASAVLYRSIPRTTVC